MLNNGLGFSDEFELEACRYSEKASSKLKQQYKEWTSTMRKEGSAFFKSVKDRVWMNDCVLGILFTNSSFVLLLTGQSSNEVGRENCKYYNWTVI